MTPEPDVREPDEPYANEADLERLLRSLPLRRPSLALGWRVRSALVPRWRRWAVPAAAAALFVALVGVKVGELAVRDVARSIPPTARIAREMTVPRPATTVALASPVRVDRAVWTEVSDGVVTVADNVPYERVHRTTVRETWYVDPKTGVRVRVEVPTEEVLLRPADVY